MKRLLRILVIAIGLAGISVAHGAAVQCAADHCGTIKDQVDATCHGTGGGLVYVPSPQDPKIWCWCKCSCVAGDTLVRVTDKAYKRMQDFKAGDTVLALQSDGTWKSAPVVSSDGMGDNTTPFPYAIYLTLTNNTSIVVAPDHVFWMPNNTLKRADRLAPSDTLVLSQGGKPIAISQITSGVYYGPMWNIVATSEQDVSDPYGHLIDTAGVVSGDWALQRKATQSLQTGPQVGTAEYRKMHVSALSKQKSLPKVVVLNKAKNIRFVPHTPVAIPKDAIHLLPEGEDQAQPSELYPLDYSVPYEMAEYLARQYKTFYPDVEYQIDWLNDAVNAVAFIKNGKRYVVLYGGLIRHHRVQVEGAGLVIAHELGHHYGGPPRYPNNTWASCEGQADYWGAKIAQRKVWWGEYSIDQTTKGAAQLLDLFSKGLLMPQGGAKPMGICSHPPAQCRYDTYMAGLRLQPKPSCAGDPALINK